MVTNASGCTAIELAKAYAEAIYSPPNGWGAHCHSIHGASHWIMARVYSLVGNDAGAALIDAAMRQHREAAPCTY